MVYIFRFIKFLEKKEEWWRDEEEKKYIHFFGSLIFSLLFFFLFFSPKQNVIFILIYYHECNINRNYYHPNQTFSSSFFCFCCLYYLWQKKLPEIIFSWLCEDWIKFDFNIVNDVTFELKNILLSLFFSSWNEVFSSPIKWIIYFFIGSVH